MTSFNNSILKIEAEHLGQTSNRGTFKLMPFLFKKCIKTRLIFVTILGTKLLLSFILSYVIKSSLSFITIKFYQIIGLFSYFLLSHILLMLGIGDGSIVIGVT